MDKTNSTWVKGDNNSLQLRIKFLATAQLNGNPNTKRRERSGYLG